MAVTYGFYNSLNKDRMYNAEQMSSIFNGIITDGVFSAIGDALTTVAGTGLQVIVKTGKAWFNGTWTLNDALLPLDIETADVSLTRIDAIILEVDSTTSVRANSIKVLKGTASANPVKPTLTSTETKHQYALAYVTVTAGATSITSGDIEINVGKSSCPFITSVLQQTNIDQLFAQWESEFDTWFANVQSQLSGDIAANLQRQIDANKAAIEANSTSIAAIKKDYGLKVDDILLTLSDNPGEEFALCNGDTVSDYDGKKLSPGSYKVMNLKGNDISGFSSRLIGIGKSNDGNIMIAVTHSRSTNVYAVIVKDPIGKKYSETYTLTYNGSNIVRGYSSYIYACGYFDGHFIVCVQTSNTSAYGFSVYMYTDISIDADTIKNTSSDKSRNLGAAAVVNNKIVCCNYYNGSSLNSSKLYIDYLESASDSFVSVTVTVKNSEGAVHGISYYSGYYIILKEGATYISTELSASTWTRISQVFLDLVTYGNELYGLIYDNQLLKIVKITNMETMSYSTIASVSGVYVESSSSNPVEYRLFKDTNNWLITRITTGGAMVYRVFIDSLTPTNIVIHDKTKYDLSAISKMISVDNQCIACALYGYINSSSDYYLASANIITSGLRSTPQVTIGEANTFIKIKALTTG